MPTIILYIQAFNMDSTHDPCLRVPQLLDG